MNVSKSRSKHSKMQRKYTVGRKVDKPQIISLVILSALLWLATFIMLFTSGPVPHSSYAPGQKAKSTVVSTVDFECDDVIQTELLLRQAADNVYPAFQINNRPLNSALHNVNVFFDHIAQQPQSAVTGTVAQSAGWAASLNLTPEEVAEFSAIEKPEELRSLIKTNLVSVWKQGICSVKDRSTLFKGVAENRLLTLTGDNQESLQTVTISELLLPDEAIQLTAQKIRRQSAGRAVSPEALQELLTPLLKPNLLYDAELTDQWIQEARRNVQPATMLIRAGTTLVEAGDRITPQILEQLRAHERELISKISPFDNVMRLVGTGFLLLLGMVLVIGLIRISKREMIHNRSGLFVMILAAVLSLLPARGLLYLSSNVPEILPVMMEFMLPQALPALLITVLLGSRCGFITGLWTALATAMLFDYNFTIFVTGLIVTMTACLAGLNIRRRSQIFRAGLWIGLAKLLTAVSLAVIHQQAPMTMLTLGSIGLLSGFITALIVLLVLPLFEYLFGITTDIRLLELSDISHPLLQRMAIEAPGTYHHSLMVANLARSAAAVIGANPLKTQVCAYYHDIGKMVKPEFFTENAQFRDNPHDELAPSMSTLVIMAHVKEGVSMAKQMKLPQCIIDAIEQHHGTGVIQYFYHRAKQQRKEIKDPRSDDRPVNDDDFRYPGPKPVSREMAILLLADSMEAASRSLEKPTPTKVENMVNELIDARLKDKQLSNSNLTFAELTAIKKSFTFTLTNMLHGRVPYPKDEDDYDSKPAGANRTESPGTGKSEPPPDEGSPS